MARLNGNRSNSVNGLDEVQAASRSLIVGYPRAVQEQYARILAEKKMDLVSLRSGFSDERDENFFSMLLKNIKAYLEIPKEILEGISTSLNDVAEQTDKPKYNKNKGLFTNMWESIKAELAPLTHMWTKNYFAKIKKQAETIVKNKIEKQQKQLAAIQKMPNSPLKKKIIQAVKKGNIAALFAPANHENIKKKDTFDRKKYDEKVLKYIDEVLEIERKMC